MELDFSSKSTTSIYKNPTTISTNEIFALRKLILNAYADINEIKDICLNILSNRVNVSVVLNRPASNDVLENLVSKQLIILEDDDSEKYFFNFDYYTKELFRPNDADVSLMS